MGYFQRMKKNPLLARAIAITIEQIRNEREMSKALLADLADIQRCYLFDILNEKKCPTLKAIFALCEALQIHPVDVIRLVTEHMEAEDIPPK